MLAMPSSVLLAQSSKPSYTTDGKKIAMSSMNNEGPKRSIGLDSIAPKAMPFALDGNEKVIKIANKQPEVKNSKSPNSKETIVANSKPAPNNVSGLIDRQDDDNDKFKRVPLAGETDYFGT